MPNRTLTNTELSQTIRGTLYIESTTTEPPSKNKQHPKPLNWYIRNYSVFTFYDFRCQTDVYGIFLLIESALKEFDRLVGVHWLINGCANLDF